MNLDKANQIYSDKKQTSGWLLNLGLEIGEGAQRTIWTDENVSYFDCSGGFMNVYIVKAP